MLVLGGAFAGAPTFVIPMSALVLLPTVVSLGAELFSSFGSIAQETVATLVMIVPGATSETMWTTSVKVALPLAARSPILQCTLPVPPTDGNASHENDGPVFCVND